MAGAVGLRSDRGPILFGMIVATGLVAMDATMIAPAIVAITRDLGDFAAFPWLFSIYLLTSSVTVPVYSKLADTFGRKPIILFGIGVFLLGSLLCGLAWSMPALIVFRAIQGIGGGAILPVAMTIVGDIYTVAERARVQGYMSAVWVIAALIGPLFGGFFSELGIWRWIFFVNLPLGAISLWFIVRRYREHHEKHPHRLDIAGAVLLTVGATLVVLGLMEGGRSWAWFSLPSFVVFGGGAALLIAFVFVERRAAEPVLPLSVLRRPLIATTVLLNLALGAALIGLTAFVPTYLEVAAGVSAVIAGFALAASSVGWSVSATFSGGLYLRVGFRVTSVIGGIVVVVGAAALLAVVGSPSALLIAAVCLVIGAGFGLTAVPSLVAAQSAVPYRERGVVTGVVMFARNIGQSLAAAVFGAIANAVIAARGGNESDPAAMIAGTTAVFVGVAVAALIMLVAAFIMPRTETIVDDDGNEVDATGGKSNA